jgi:L-amino acid N-acyltransferase YncA
VECTTERKPVFTLQVSEGEAAKADERVDEVVIGVGPAFGKHQHKTLIDMPHNAILKELVAGIEEEAACASSEICAPQMFLLWHGMRQTSAAQASGLVSSRKEPR